MKPTPLNLLLNLAQKPGKKTTIQIASELGVSQQTASRWLSEMQREGMVEKTPLGYRLTNQAFKTIFQLKNIAEKAANSIEIQGSVVKGLGDGAYYIGLPGYSDQIKQKLGFKPYLGTLNLRITGKSDLENREKIQTFPGIKLTGFQHQGRFLGGARCFKAKINGKTDCAIIIPDRTHHDANIMEVISAKYLRKELALKNGAVTKITIEVGN